MQRGLHKIEETKPDITTVGVKPFELYGNLLSNKARQPWEEVIKAQVTRAPWEDVFGNTHWDSHQNLGLLP